MDIEIEKLKALTMEEDTNMFSVDNIRKGLLKLLEDLFRHVLQVTEKIESTTGYDFSNRVREFEKFATESGLLLPSELESETEFQSLSEVYSAFGSASGYASGFSSAPGYATGFGNTSGYATGFGSASGYATGFGSASGYAAGFGSASGYATGFGSASGYASGFDAASEFESGIGFGPDFSQVYDMYDKNIGLAIQRVLTEVAGTEIDQFYQSIKDKIQIRENLKKFLKHLAEKFLNGSHQQELYFLAIVSRIFTMLYKSDGMNPKTFLEGVVNTLLDGGIDLQFGSINAPELISDILNGSNDWICEFRDLKCGDPSDYFSS